ncbi:Aminoglycoside phosphotransferase [Penicillium cf. viridicatum]|uniref:Altered inheritance of mitochondria protein 9, mitochondrial n=1 Tax=Penicillium cf. viridicatum TaxID=2972119 RepID=A0A9W9IPL0_9EURO|nr:Aminoglycoside phosphotransferase [Penicillium cf. viridicatum]
MITQVIDIQNTLIGVIFDMHGFIYFKDDFRSLGEEPGEANIQSATASIPDIFTIGPLTTGELWNGSLKPQEHPDDGLGLLTKYMKVAPYLIPKSTNEAASNNVLMHPSLHLDNIFVDPETLQVTRIVDWQSACVAPLLYHADVPKMCTHHGPLQGGSVVPERAEEFDSLSAE